MACLHVFKSFAASLLSQQISPGSDAALQLHLVQGGGA